MATETEVCSKKAPHTRGVYVILSTTSQRLPLCVCVCMCECLRVQIISTGTEVVNIALGPHRKSLFIEVAQWY